MSPFIAALYMTSAASLSIGGLAGIAWWRRRDLTHHGLFALMAVFAGLKVLMEPVFYQATDVDQYVWGLRWQIVFIIAFLGAFAWFLPAYTGVARRSLAALITGVLAVDLVIHLASPFTLLYRDITGLDMTALPWGERIAVAHGPAWTGIRPIVEAPGILLAVMFVDAAWRMWKRGMRRKVAVLSAAYVPFFVLFSLWGPLIDLGVVRSPYLGTFAFLVIVLVFGSDLANDVARASRLADEVSSRERRWGTLVRNVHLAVVRVDTGGTIVEANPFFCDLMGEAPEALRGRAFVELLPPASRRDAGDRYAAILTGDATPPAERTVIDSSGAEHTLLWSAVAVVEDDGRPSGAITIGSDITERIAAQEERDRAISELRDLKEQLEEENVYLRHEITSTHGFDEIIGDSAELRYVLHRVDQVAGTDSTVLVEGETGVGKELVARAIHSHSRRADAPFVRVNCGALPPSLIESELFGHERGAFTGATGLRKGRFELADGGTLFLDEVAELPLELQAKLLRVLQDGEFERVGSSQTRTADVRIVAATNRNLHEEVKAGRFRQDLYYRLNVYPITVPPLRDREGDIAALVGYFVRRISERMGREVAEVTARDMRSLEAYSWPGNVRELQNVLERAVILSDGPVLRLPPRVPGEISPAGAHVSDGDGSDPTAPRLITLADLEREHIRAVLEWTGGRVAGPDGAAEILGLHPNTLRSRMKKLGIQAARA